MVEIHSDYLLRVYDETKFKTMVDRCIDKAVELMLAHPFAAIAFSGMSGAAMAYPLSYKLGIPLICVRKKEDSSHHLATFAGSVRGLLEGHLNAPSFLIVDDMVSSGTTVRYIANTIWRWNAKSQCVGILLYQGGAGWSDSVTINGVSIPKFFIEHDDLGARGRNILVPPIA